MVIDSTLVPKDAPTGSTVRLTTIDSRTVECPQVLVNVATPYYRGKLWALSMDRAIAPMIIGNSIKGEDGAVYVVSGELPQGVEAAVTTRVPTTGRKVLRPMMRIDSQDSGPRHVPGVVRQEHPGLNEEVKVLETGKREKEGRDDNVVTKKRKTKGTLKKTYTED